MDNKSSTPRKFTHVKSLNNIKIECGPFLDEPNSNEIPYTSNGSYTKYNSEKPTKLPLKITQDQFRLIINLANDSKNETNTCENTTNITDTIPIKSSAKKVKSRKFKSCLGKSVKPSVKNENLINIIRENCEKSKIMPCDTFIAPLLALSDYYSKFDSDPAKSNIDQNLSMKKTKDNESSISEFESLLKKTIASNSELILFQKQQSLNLKKFASSRNRKTETKKESKSKKLPSNTNVHLKEIICQAGDLSHFYMPIIHLGDIDPTRKKSNRLLETFRQGVAYYKNKTSSRSGSVCIEKKLQHPEVRNHSVPSRPVSLKIKNSPKIFMDRYSPIVSPVPKTFKNKSRKHTTESESYETTESDKIVNKSLNGPENYEKSLMPKSLISITNSIGDIIKLLKTSPSGSDSFTNSEKNVHSSNAGSSRNQSCSRLHALNAEIDKTMSEISKFKNEVSSRIQRHNQNIDLTEYEKDLLNLLSPNEFLSNNYHTTKSTSSTGVNTDISMSNTFFSYKIIDDYSQSSAARKSNIQSIWTCIPHNVIINEMPASEHNRFSMAEEIVDEYQEKYTLPIIETPDTSKHESPRKMNQNQHQTDFDSFMQRKQSQLVNKESQKARLDPASVFSNIGSLPVYRTKELNSQFSHNFKHQRNFDEPSEDSSSLPNFGEIYKNNDVCKLGTEESDIGIDEEFEGEFFSNESTDISEVQNDPNVFKKIFAREAYTKYDKNNKQSFEYGESAGSIPLVKSNKKYGNSNEKQKSRTHSTSTVSNSPSLDFNMSRPVSLHPHSRIIKHQPLTRMPILDFAEQHQHVLKQQIHSKKVPIYYKRRSNTYDASQFHSNYENFQNLNKENPQPYIDPFIARQNSFHLSRTNTKHRMNNKMPNLQQNSSSGSINETSSEKFVKKKYSEKSPTHVLYPMSTTPSKRQDSSSYNSSSKEYEDPIRFMTTVNRPRSSKSNKAPLQDRNNRSSVSNNPRRALTLSKNNEGKIEDQFLLSLNDFRRPHSAFQIDNPPDMSKSQMKFLQSEKRDSINVLKQGNFMNQFLSNSSSFRNGTPECSCEHQSFVKCMNNVRAKRSGSLKTNNLNQSDVSENSYKYTQEVPVYERPRVKRQNSDGKPVRYYIHYPMSSAANETRIDSLEEKIFNYESGLKTPDSNYLTQTIESVMLKAYKLPEKISNSHRY